MIASLTGLLRHVDDDRCLLEVGPVVYELLIPAADVEHLRGRANETVCLHTQLYLEGDASSGGNLEPRLIGFRRATDKQFFLRFTTVKGIGPKKALRALVAPVPEIARAIEEKDARALCRLPQIGKRLAEQIIAELSGKLMSFVAVMPGEASTNGRAAAVIRRSRVEEDAIASLVALGERRADAEALLDRARQSGVRVETADALVREMLRLRVAR
jgi:Holliday junction DNA helicase RuvA